MKISILIPCHNEEKSIGACVESCLNQNRPLDQILVVNDGSTDNSGKILEKFGDKIDVVRVFHATGNKSRAQEIGLGCINGDIFIATDADTVLHPDFAKYVEQDFKTKKCASVGGYVKSLKYNWLTAYRELDYFIGQEIFKRGQSRIGALYVVPGCASAFVTKIFRENLNFDHDTVTEDLDFTYKLHELGFSIHFDDRAVVYTQDPPTLPSYVNQMRRWYGGGFQNLLKHFRAAKRPKIAIEMVLIYFEGLVSALMLFLLPFIRIEIFIFFYLLNSVPVFFFAICAAISRKRFDLLMICPLHPIIGVINSYVFLEQFVKEVLLKKKTMTWLEVKRVDVKASP